MKTDLDNLIDRTAAQIRATEPDAPVMRQASDRVWAQMMQETTAVSAVVVDAAAPLDSCAVIQAAIPAYLQGTVSESRALLLADHTRECIPCRKVLTQARTGQVTARRAVAPALATSRKPLARQLRWAVSAALLCAVGAGAWFAYDRFVPTGTSHATLRGAEGAVYRINGATMQTLNVGEELQSGESLRTAPNARAQVTLADGSSLEVKDRSEFSVSETGSGATIVLD